MYCFNYHGKGYYSLRQFCQVKKISYSKVVRYCRHYIRARDNPEVACDWVIENVRPPVNEARTHKYYADQELTQDRVYRFKAKVKRAVRDNF